jgi:hypothetical protein
MAVKVPEWLARRDGSLKPGPYGETWYVMLGGEPQYKLAPVPVAGKYGCAITQTINGKLIESTARADTADGACQAGLEDLRKALGW